MAVRERIRENWLNVVGPLVIVGFAIVSCRSVLNTTRNTPDIEVHDPSALYSPTSTFGGSPTESDQYVETPYYYSAELDGVPAPQHGKLLIRVVINGVTHFIPSDSWEVYDFYKRGFSPIFTGQLINHGDETLAEMYIEGATFEEPRQSGENLPVSTDGSYAYFTVYDD